ncbi:hypothetical protein BJ912DRAFT_930043 [Pholiota molesta]|nr:hypothetical protein BJ912DRAFT_930043 [Pholiota molesta]
MASLQRTPTAPVLDLFSLKGQNALVTGASRGIGAACALALAQAGADLCLVLRPAAPGSGDHVQTIATIREQSPATKITVVHCDLSDTEDVKTVFPKALALMGEIHILVNCAGIQRRAPAVQFPESDWDDYLPIPNGSSLFAKPLGIPVLFVGYPSPIALKLW